MARIANRKPSERVTPPPMMSHSNARGINAKTMAENIACSFVSRISLANKKNAGMVSALIMDGRNCINLITEMSVTSEINA